MNIGHYKSENINKELEFNYSLIMRKYVRPMGVSKWVEYLKEKTENSKLINYSCYNIERYKESKSKYHAHYLTNLNKDYNLDDFSQLAAYLFKEITGEYKIFEGVERQTLKIRKSNLDCSDVSFQDKYFDIPYKKIYSKLGSIYIQPVVAKNVVFYNNKYSDWGITDGFFYGMK